MSVSLIVCTSDIQASSCSDEATNFGQLLVSHIESNAYSIKSEKHCIARRPSIVPGVTLLNKNVSILCSRAPYADLAFQKLDSAVVKSAVVNY